MSWKATLDNWQRFIDAMSSDQGQSNLLLSSLSPAQKCSFQVLKEWWDSSYCSPYLINTARRYLKNSAGSPSLLGIHTPEFRKRATENALTNASLYHTACFDLFCREFHPRGWQPFQSTISLESLQRSRESAVSKAVCQRIAFSFLSQNTSVVQLGPYPQPARQENGWFEGKKVNEMPYYL
ncbi:hypothetical protein F4782DRAFT_444780 [Xylaria castorea]|nr:hypothetical protein F4782DRAFT_444780 [Xylaria castorea]